MDLHLSALSSSPGKIAVFSLVNYFPQHFSTGVLGSHCLPFILASPWSLCIQSVHHMPCHSLESLTLVLTLPVEFLPPSLFLSHHVWFISHFSQSTVSITSASLSTSSECSFHLLQNMDGRDVKPCSDLRAISRNLEYRLHISCSY